MTSEAQLQVALQSDTDFIYHANCREFDAINRSLIKETNIEACWQGVRRLKQLNDELEALGD